MDKPTTISPLARAVLREREGLKKRRADGMLVSYKCPAGKWTIGEGCTRGVTEGMVRSPDQCEAMLQAELRIHVARVLKLVEVEVTQGMLDALVLADFNAGLLQVKNKKTKRMEPSTLLRRLNAGDEEGAIHALAAWNKYHDPETGEIKIAPGLVTRRAYETALWRGTPELLPDDIRADARRRGWRPAPTISRLAEIEENPAALDATPQAVMPPPMPRTMAESRTGNASIGLGLGSGTAMLTAAKEVATEAKETGDAVGALAGNLPMAVLLAVGLAGLLLAAFVWWDRRRRLVMETV